MHKGTRPARSREPPRIAVPFLYEKVQRDLVNDSKVIQRSKNGLAYIIIGALIPVFPFYLFISHYLSLGMPFACIHYGWFSDCGLYAGIWLVTEAIGLCIITKGLFLKFKN